MKKLGLVTIAVLMTFMLAGCGKKQTLSCVQKPSGVDVEFNIDFEGKKVVGMDFHYNVDLSSLTDDQIETLSKQDFCETVKNSMEDYKEAFTKCDHKIESKKMLVDAVLDVDKVAKEEKNKMTSIEEAKTQLENTGYTCTIK